MKKRIWELDVLRGIWILLMFAIHIGFDLVVLFEAVELKNPTLFNLSQEWGGDLFLVISGICVTLGSHPVKRGLQVLVCGLVITAVTAGMYLLGIADGSILICFGVLHCLGCCMLLWPLFQNQKTWVLCTVGLALFLLGQYLLAYVRADFPWLLPFGVMYWGFSSVDYFPLLPNFGSFLIGACIGRTVYRDKATLFPKVNPRNPIIRFFTFFGKHSLIIYMIHQPIIAGVLWLILRAV